MAFNEGAFSDSSNDDDALLPPLSEVFNQMIAESGDEAWKTDHQGGWVSQEKNQQSQDLDDDPSATVDHHIGPGMVIPSATPPADSPTPNPMQNGPQEHSNERQIALIISIVVFFLFTTILFVVAPSARQQLSRMFCRGKNTSTDEEQTPEHSPATSPALDEKETLEKPSPRSRFSDYRSSLRAPSWLKMPSQIASTRFSMDRSRSSSPASTPPPGLLASPRIVKQVLDIRTDWLRSRFSDSSSELEYEDVIADDMLSTIPEAEEFSMSITSPDIPDHQTPNSLHGYVGGAPLMRPEVFFTLPSTGSLAKVVRNQEMHERSSSEPVGLFGRDMPVTPEPLMEEAKRARRSMSASIKSLRG